MKRIFLTICLSFTANSCYDERIIAKQKEAKMLDSSLSVADSIAVKLDHVIHELDSKQVVYTKKPSARLKQLEKENKHLKDSIKNLHEYFVTDPIDGTAYQKSY
jgi:predicted membrane chloride channel (bestrophin family)